MRRRTLHLASALALLGMAIPTLTLANHEILDERPPTPFEEFRNAVGSWVEPWRDISGTSIADDHAPWVAFGLYEELLSIRPEPCYLDTYAASWALAASLRTLGQAPTRELMEVAAMRVLQNIERADALAELDAPGCVAIGTDTDTGLDTDLE